MITELLESATINDVAPDEVWAVQYQALIRMQIYFTGETHKMLNNFYNIARMILADGFGDNSELDGLALHQVTYGIEQAWSQAFKQWQTRFEELRREAAEIAFGGLAVLHERYVRPALTEAKALTEAALHEAIAIVRRPRANATSVFAPQVQAVIDAANQRVYADGIPLSTRLWRLDQQTRLEIQRIIYQGVSDKQSAWNLAKQLQQYLGFGADCPRWTSTRLRLTKKQIAEGDLRGLKSGEECRGQGVAYNALRLARNELQIIHALATDALMNRLPFIEKEQINLSPSHPENDECDAVIAGGEGGKGIYAKGTIGLPIHIQCLCYKTAVLPTPDQFTGQLQGWLDGSQPWPAMDQYQTLIGGDVAINLSEVLEMATLLRWAFNARPGQS